MADNAAGGAAPGERHDRQRRLQGRFGRRGSGGGRNVSSLVRRAAAADLAAPAAPACLAAAAAAASARQATAARASTLEARESFLAPQAGAPAARASAGGGSGGGGGGGSGGGGGGGGRRRPATSSPAAAAASAAAAPAASAAATGASAAAAAAASPAAPTGASAAAAAAASTRRRRRLRRRRRAASGGGGGLGAGGDIFVMAGASLTIVGGSLAAGTVAGGDGRRRRQRRGVRQRHLPARQRDDHTRAGERDDRNDLGRHRRSDRLAAARAPTPGPAASRSNGAGTIDLTAANTFTGGVTIDKGALELGKSAAAGSGGITFAAGADASLDLNAGVYLPNVILGFATGDTLKFAGDGSATLAAPASGGAIDMTSSSAGEYVRLKSGTKLGVLISGFTSGDSVDFDAVRLRCDRQDRLRKWLRLGRKRRRRHGREVQCESEPTPRPTSTSATMPPAMFWSAMPPRRQAPRSTKPAAAAPRTFLDGTIRSSPYRSRKRTTASLGSILCCPPFRAPGPTRAVSASTMTEPSTESAQP